MAAPVVQLRVPEDMLAVVDGARGDGTRSAWILALIERELLAESPTPVAGHPHPLAAIGDGEPSPGVVCMGPGCWQRDTSRFGLRRVPLCPACVSALRGETYQRQTPPGAARLIHRGAA